MVIAFTTSDEIVEVETGTTIYSFIEKQYFEFQKRFVHVECSFSLVDRDYLFPVLPIARLNF